MTFSNPTMIDFTAEDLSDCGKQGMMALAVGPDVDRVTGHSRDPKYGCLIFLYDHLQRMN